MEPKTKRDFYSEITNAIVAELEKGVRPWVKPWESNDAFPCRPLRITGEPYRGINILLLWSAAHRQGYRSPYWLTFKQAQQLGGHIRKDEKSTLVVFSGTLTRTGLDESGEPEEKAIPFLKAYSVFNTDQTNGLPEKYHATIKDAPPLHDHERNETVDQFVSNTNANIDHGGERALYSPLEDRIHMPDLGRFKDADAYYSTMLHELTHWTGRDERCPRKFRPSILGTANYAREELIAELGAAFLCADLHISLTPRSDHAEYIANWLEVLRNDKRAIFHAAAAARNAADFLYSLQQSERAGEQSARKTA